MRHRGVGPADWELALEWIQVLPEYRRRGVGQLIVRELLYRMAGIARFATVSGRADSESHPEALYRKCGFEGQGRLAHSAGVCDMFASHRLARRPRFHKKPVFCPVA
ncbi:MAG: GNAT family N-acetyltransferase [Oscillospiraceae bacterium]